MSVTGRRVAVTSDCACTEVMQRRVLVTFVLEGTDFNLLSYQVQDIRIYGRHIVSHFY